MEDPGQDGIAKPERDAPTLPEDYEFLEELGRGGMAVVYRVRQRSLDRTLALKVLHQVAALDAGLLERFRREAESLARVRHPRIVAVHEVGQLDEAAYYTMDLIEGTTLAETIRSGSLTPRRIVTILGQVADAIAHSHSLGVIHRDLKPANILIDEQGDAYVADFGLARDLDASTELTRTGNILGTPAYMSPEQARGERERIDGRTDVYALGAVLYECLTRHPPFEDPSLHRLLLAVMDEEPVPPRRRNRKTPADLELICLKALAKDPRRRYATAEALRDDLRRFEQGLPVEARPPSAVYRASRFVRRNLGALVASGATAAVLLLLALVTLLPRMGRSPVTVLEDAERLAAAGQHEAAMMLLEAEADRQGYAWPLREEEIETLRGRLLLLLADCRLETARRHREDGRPERAIPLLESLASEVIGVGVGGHVDYRASPWPARADAAWEMWACLLLAGRDAPGRNWQYAASRLESQLADEGHDASTSRVARLLELLDGALRDPSHPAHGRARREVETWIRNRPSGWPQAFDAWLRRRPAGGVPLVLAALRAERRAFSESRVFDDRSHGINVPGAWRDAARTLGGTEALPALLDGLLALLEDTGLPALNRRAALELLIELADLPLDPPKRDGELPERAAFALDLLRRMRGLAPTESLRALVARTIETILARDEPGFLVPAKLHELVGAPAGAGREELAEWWRTRATLPPSTWLASALGLSEPPRAADLAGLLARLIEARGPERRWCHELMRLLAPPGSAVPRFAEGDDPTRSLALRWLRVVRAIPDLEDPHPERYRIDVVALHVDPVLGSPTPFWHGSREVGLDEAWHLSGTHRLDVWAPVEPFWMDHGLLIPGLTSHRHTRPSPGLDVEIEGELRIGWTADSVSADRPALIARRRYTFAAEAPGILPLSPNRHWARHDASWILGEPGEVCAQVDDLEFLRRWSHRIPGPGRDRQVVALIAWHGRVGEEPADWRARLRSELETRAAGAPGGQEGRPRVWEALGAYIPLPELREELATLGRDLTASGAWPLTLVGSRLLAGDESVLDEPDVREWLVVQRTDAKQRQTWLWTRLLGTTSSDALRRTAAEILSNEAPPLALARLADATGGVAPLPEKLRSRVDSAHRRLRDPAIEMARPAWLALGGLHAAALTLLALSLLPRKRFESRLVPAALLTALGVALNVYFVSLRGLDLLPAAWGHGLAALGTGILARGARGRARHVSSVGFAAAAILDVLSRLEIAESLTSDLALVAAAVGLVGLAALVFLLLDRRPGPFVVFFLFYAVPLMLAHGLHVLDPTRGENAYEALRQFVGLGQVETLAHLLLLMAVGILLLWTVLATRLRVSPRAPAQGRRRPGRRR